MNIYCAGCSTDVDARLTSGEEIYPHRPDLYDLPFWKCDTCKNFVGCHHKTSEPTTPLGCIPTPEIKNIRKKIHALIDPIWKEGRLPRKHVYARLSKRFGRMYHTGELSSVEDAMTVYSLAVELDKETSEEKVK